MREGGGGEQEQKFEASCCHTQPYAEGYVSRSLSLSYRSHTQPLNLTTIGLRYAGLECHAGLLS